LYPERVATDEPMAWDATDSLDDARDVTESLLRPVSRGVWLRLAVVAFFVSGVGGEGSVGQGVQGIASSPSPPTATLDAVDLPTLPALAPERLTALAAGALVVLVAALVGYALVGAVMEFVLVEGVRTRRLTLRRTTRQFLGPGLRLFAFRTAVVAVLAASVALPALVVVGVLSVSLSGALLVPVVGLVVAATWAVGVLCLRLTTDFVVPTMLAEGRTVLSAWRRFLSVALPAWREVALYLVVRLVLGVAATLLVGLAVGLVALVVAIPFALLGSLVVSTVGLQGSGLVAVALLATVFVPTVVAAAVVVQVPVVVYLRSYGLVFLGRLDDRLALV
jgi:hypothetical protein